MFALEDDAQAYVVDVYAQAYVVDVYAQAYVVDVYAQCLYLTPTLKFHPSTSLSPFALFIFTQMGLSSSSANEVDFEEIKRKEQEYMHTIAELEEKEKQLIDSAAKHNAEYKDKVAAATTLQQTNSTQRITEMETQLKRMEELQNLEAHNIICASQLVCAILCNYQFGEIDYTSDPSWEQNIEKVLTQCLSTPVFWILCKIPYLLPLLWITGKGCDEFHKYELDTSNIPSIEKHRVKINTLIDNYVASNVRTYIKTLCQTNCYKYKDIDESRDNNFASICKSYLDNMNGERDITTWYNSTMKLFNNFNDGLNWKCYAARSKKGICDSPILLLPSTYPKYCPKYELYESLLMVSNTIMNHYGDMRTDIGGPVKADSGTDVTEGGKCFNLTSSWLSNALSNGINTSDIWDLETFISISELELSEDLITSSSNSDTWMKETSVNNETQTFGASADGSGGYKKYVNPTQIYTQQFINDMDEIEVLFQMPRLGANMNEWFRINYLYNIFSSLTKETKYSAYNIYNSQNRNLFNSIDYLYLTPKGYEQLDNVSPICRYVYEVLIQYSCKWFLTFPVDSMMSMYKINKNILNTHKTEALPQYIWIDDTVSKNTADKKYDNKPTFKFNDYYPMAVTIEKKNNTK